MNSYQSPCDQPSTLPLSTATAQPTTDLFTAARRAGGRFRD